MAKGRTRSPETLRYLAWIKEELEDGPKTIPYLVSIVPPELPGLASTWKVKDIIEMLYLDGIADKKRIKDAKPMGRKGGALVVWSLVTDAQENE